MLHSLHLLMLGKQAKSHLGGVGDGCRPGQGLLKEEELIEKVQLMSLRFLITELKTKVFIAVRIVFYFWSS